MNASPAFQIALSPLDFDRFGVRTAKALHVTHDAIPQLLAFCKKERVQFCIARCATTEMSTVHALETEGFRLMDTLIYHRLSLRKVEFDPKPSEGVLFRSATPADAEAIRAIAGRSFDGYPGHYYNDPRLLQEKSKEVYVDWAHRTAVQKNPKETVLVGEIEGKVSGFASVGINPDNDAEGLVFAVDPAGQGRGLYKYFVMHAALWGHSQGARHLIVSTQITNIMVQRVWAKLGCVLIYSGYTLHGWFD